jgi:hypothetical protein
MVVIVTRRQPVISSHHETQNLYSSLDASSDANFCWIPFDIKSSSDCPNHHKLQCLDSPQRVSCSLTPAWGCRVAHLAMDGRVIASSIQLSYVSLTPNFINTELPTFIVLGSAILLPRIRVPRSSRNFSFASSTSQTRSSQRINSSEGDGPVKEPVKK